MSMSKAERKLPQYCYCHPRTDYRSFHPDEGKFIENFSRFICWGCLSKQYGVKQANALRRVSQSELDVAIWLDSCHAGHKRHFELGGFEFDFAFPEQKVLLEIDGSKHKKRNTKRLDQLKDWEVTQAGWRVIHVPTGDGLLKRASDALMAYLTNKI